MRSATGATRSATSAGSGLFASAPPPAPTGLTYSQLIHGLKALGIELDRKMLAEMAVKDQLAFAELAGKVKTAVESQKAVDSQKSTVES